MSADLSETRKRKMRLKRKSIDIANYRLHPQAIEERAWRNQVTVTRAGKPWFCLPTPWLMRPSFRNRSKRPANHELRGCR